MRRILVPYLSAIFPCLKTKFVHDITISLWQPAKLVATKRQTFQKNECWICLQHVWKTFFSWNLSQRPQSCCPHRSWVSLQSVWQIIQKQKEVEIPHEFNACWKGSFKLWHQIWWDPMHLSFCDKQQFEGPQEKSTWEIDFFSSTYIYDDNIFWVERCNLGIYRIDQLLSHRINGHCSFLLSFFSSCFPHLTHAYRWHINIL